MMRTIRRALFYHAGEVEPILIVIYVISSGLLTDHPLTGTGAALMAKNAIYRRWARKWRRPAPPCCRHSLQLINYLSDGAIPRASHGDEDGDDMRRSLTKNERHSTIRHIQEIPWWAQFVSVNGIGQFGGLNDDQTDQGNGQLTSPRTYFLWKPVARTGSCCSTLLAPGRRTSERAAQVKDEEITKSGSAGKMQKWQLENLKLSESGFCYTCYNDGVYVVFNHFKNDEMNDISG